MVQLLRLPLPACLQADEAAAARQRLADMRQGLAASGLGPSDGGNGGAGPSGRDSREGGRDSRDGGRDSRCLLPAARLGMQIKFLELLLSVLPPHTPSAAA